MSKSIITYPGPGIPEDTHRLTYAELADVRGISKAGAERLARRRRWPRQLGNDGVTRVTVTLAEASTETADKRKRVRSDVRPTTSPLTPADIIPPIREATASLAETLTTLTDSLKAERLACDQATDAIAAEAIARAEAAALRAELERRQAWKIFRRLRWALRPR